MAAATTSSSGGNTPAPSGPASSAGSPVAGLTQYFRDVRVELKKAEWPNRAELIRLTQVTLLLIAITAAYCGSLDALLSLITNRLFNHSTAAVIAGLNAFTA